MWGKTKVTASSGKPVLSIFPVQGADIERMEIYPPVHKKDDRVLVHRGLERDSQSHIRELEVRNTKHLGRREDGQTSQSQRKPADLRRSLHVPEHKPCHGEEGLSPAQGCPGMVMKLRQGNMYGVWYICIDLCIYISGSSTLGFCAKCFCYVICLPHGPSKR